MATHKREVMLTMNKRLLGMLVLLLQVQLIWAGEIYKWTDENGKVHFGDQQAKPSAEKGVDTGIRTHNTKPVTIDNNQLRDQIINQIAQKMVLDAQANKDIYVPPFDASAAEFGTRKVDSVCQELAETFAKQSSGDQELENKFRRGCSGVTYYCEQYKRFPEKDKCYWVKQRRSRIVEMKIYN